LSFEQGDERPKLTGEWVSKQLRFADLAPLIGADSNEHKAARGEQNRQPAGKVLPVETFDTDAWAAMDADIKFTVKRIEYGDTLPLSDLYTHLVMNAGQILLDPLRFGVAGGALNTTLRLEGNKSLRSPLYVHGTFAELSPGVKAGPLIARGAAALLALVSPTSGEENQRTPVLNKIKAADASGENGANVGQNADDE
jgi:uncharacterized protein involved in outer membrane biogenesis